MIKKIKYKSKGKVSPHKGFKSNQKLKDEAIKKYFKTGDYEQWTKDKKRLGITWENVVDRNPQIIENKKGGKIKSKYNKGGGVRKSKYSL